MFDLKSIREQPEAFDRGLARRGLPAQSPEVLRLDKAWREIQTEAERVQAERNRLSKEIGSAKAKGQDVAVLLKEVAASKDRQAALEAEAAKRYRVDAGKIQKAVAQEFAAKHKKQDRKVAAKKKVAA